MYLALGEECELGAAPCFSGCSGRCRAVKSFALVQAPRVGLGLMQRLQGDQNPIFNMDPCEFLVAEEGGELPSLFWEVLGLGKDVGESIC